MLRVADRERRDIGVTKEEVEEFADRVLEKRDVGRQEYEVAMVLMDEVRDKAVELGEREPSNANRGQWGCSHLSVPASRACRAAAAVPSMTESNIL